MDYIISEEYQKAESAFEFALDEKKSDEKATALLTQIVSYQELLKEFDEGDFDLAKESANEVIEIENGSSALIQKSEDFLEIIEELETTLTEETEKYEIALGHFEAGEYEEANTQLDEISNDNLEHLIFDLLNKDIEKLNEDIESAQLAEKQEAEEKEKAAQQQAEKEEQIQKDKQAEESATRDNKSEDEILDDLLAEAIPLIEKEFDYIEKDSYIYWGFLGENTYTELEKEVRVPDIAPDAEPGDMFLSFLVDRFRYSGYSKDLWIYDSADHSYSLYE